MILLGPEQQHITTQHHLAVQSARFQADDHEECPVVLECDDISSETNKLRRPQEEDEYWSISATAWSQSSHARQAVLSHVGRINETSEGEQAPQGDCKKCEESGSECMVFRDSVRHATRSAVDLICSRCRFRGLVCSHASHWRVAKKKIKRRPVRFRSP